jgi:hypothetical protein
MEASLDFLGSFRSLPRTTGAPLPGDLDLVDIPGPRLLGLLGDDLSLVSARTGLGVTTPLPDVFTFWASVERDESSRIDGGSAASARCRRGLLD